MLPARVTEAGAGWQQACGIIGGQTDDSADMLLGGTGYTYSRIQAPLKGSNYSCSPALDNDTEDNLQNLLLAGQAAINSDDFARVREALAARRAERAR